MAAAATRHLVAGPGPSHSFGAGAGGAGTPAGPRRRHPPQPPPRPAGAAPGEGETTAGSRRGCLPLFAKNETAEKRTARSPQHRSLSAGLRSAPDCQRRPALAAPQLPHFTVPPPPPCRHHTLTSKSPEKLYLKHNVPPGKGRAPLAAAEPRRSLCSRGPGPAGLQTPAQRTPSRASLRRTAPREVGPDSDRGPRTQDPRSRTPPQDPGPRTPILDPASGPRTADPDPGPGTRDREPGTGTPELGTQT